MRLKKSPFTPPVVAGRWALRDLNGKYLLATREYTRSDAYLGRDVFAWTDLEEASLHTHEDALKLLGMFPAGSATLTEIRRREVV